jgi:hypothetical protein
LSGFDDSITVTWFPPTLTKTKDIVDLVKTKSKVTQYALLISPRAVTRGDSISPFGTMTIRIVYMNGDKITTDSPFNGLVFACQWSENNPMEATYGWNSFYHEVWRIEHADAERMVKMLRKVKRVCASASVASFGEYVAFVGGALKIKRAFKESKHPTSVPGFNYNEYVGVDISGVASVIDEIVVEVRSSAARSAMTG